MVRRNGGATLPGGTAGGPGSGQNGLGARRGPARRGLAPESGSAGSAGSRAMRRTVRSETSVSLAIRPCGTDAASNNRITSRFLSEYTLSSRSREPSRGPPVREDKAERPESGSAGPARFSGTRTSIPGFSGFPTVPASAQLEIDPGPTTAMTGLPSAVRQLRSAPFRLKRNGARAGLELPAAQRRSWLPAQ